MYLSVRPRHSGTLRSRMGCFVPAGWDGSRGERARRLNFPGHSPNVPPGHEIIHPSPNRQRAGQKLQRPRNGDIGITIRMPVVRPAQHIEPPRANGVGHIPRRTDKQYPHVRIPPGQFGTHKLVSPPDVVPRFKGNENQCIHNKPEQRW